MINYPQGQNTGGSSIIGDQLLSIDCCKCNNQIKTEYYHFDVTKLEDKKKYQLLLCNDCYQILEEKSNEKSFSQIDLLQSWLDRGKIKDYHEAILGDKFKCAQMKGEINYCDQCNLSSNQVQQFYDHLKRYANRVDDQYKCKCEVQKIHLAKLIAQDQIKRDSEMIENLNKIIEDNGASEDDKLFAIFRKKEIITKYQ